MCGKKKVSNLNEMDDDGLGITIKQPLTLRLILCDHKGEPLYQVDEVPVEPGTIVNWEYPADGIRVTVS
jgi:hypothetical protein